MKYHQKFSRKKVPCQSGVGKNILYPLPPGWDKIGGQEFFCSCFHRVTYRIVLNTVPSRIVSRLEYSPHQKLEILIESSLKQSPHSNNIQNIVNIALQNYYITCLTRQERPSQTHHLLRRGYFYVQGTKYVNFQQNISTDMNSGTSKN